MKDLITSSSKMKLKNVNLILHRGDQHCFLEQ